MNDVAEHEGRFHDHGEQVDEPYPRQSERPLRTGVAKIISNDGGGAYTITEQVWTGAAWTNGTAPGQYVGVTVRDISESQAGSVNDYVPFWEQYDQDGVIELIISVDTNTDTDEKVASQSGQAANYLGVVLQAADQWATVATSGANVNVGTGEPLHESDPNIEISFGTYTVAVIMVGGYSTQAVTKIRIDSKGWTCAVYYSGAWYEWPDFAQAI